MHTGNSCLDGISCNGEWLKPKFDTKIAWDLSFVIFASSRSQCIIYFPKEKYQYLSYYIFMEGVSFVSFLTVPLIESACFHGNNRTCMEHWTCMSTRTCGSTSLFTGTRVVKFGLRLNNCTCMPMCKTIRLSIFNMLRFLSLFLK